MVRDVSINAYFTQHTLKHQTQKAYKQSHVMVVIGH